MPQQFLERTDVVIVLKGMHRERAAQGVGLARLRETSLQDRSVLECALQDGLMQMVAMALTCDPINVDPGASSIHPRLRLPPIPDGPCRRAP